MIIIIDEASAKLASFYYHDEIFKLQWRSVAGKASMSEELQEKLYVALPADESINDFQKQRYKNLQLTPRKLIREIKEYRKLPQTASG